MASKNQACLIASDEEDEDGNLSSVGSEASMGEGDEEFDPGNLSEFSSSGSEVENDEGDDEDEENFEGDKEHGNQTKTNKKVSTLKSKSVSFKESADSSSSPAVSINGKQSLTKENNLFAFRPTPRSDEILKNLSAFIETDEPPPRKKTLQDSRSKQSSEKIKSPNTNQMIGELIPSVNKVDPDSLLIKEESESDFKVTDPLLVKKVRYIKLEIKEEVDSSDEDNKDDIKLFSFEENSLELNDYEKSQATSSEDQNVLEDKKLKQSNLQNKRKRKDDDDPSYSPETKKKSTLSNTQNNGNQKEKTPVLRVALLRIDDKQSPVIATRRTEKPPKSKVLPLAEISKESQNNHLSDVQVICGKDTDVCSPKVLSALGKTQRKSVNQTHSDLQPTTSVISCDSNNAKPVALRKRGRPPKAENQESSQHSQKQSVPTANGSKKLTRNQAKSK